MELKDILERIEKVAYHREMKSSDVQAIVESLKNLEKSLKKPEKIG